MSSGVERKLTTILAADAAGYSRAMEADEVRALGALRASRDVFAKFIDRHGGRIVNTAGDGLIAEFPSVVEAVQCAIEVQGELGDLDRTAEGTLRFRIGIHLGDVIVDGSDLLGEGVNLAARLQSMAAPGGVLISQQVYDQVHAKLSVGFDYLGEKRPKNYSEDVAIYEVALGKKKRGLWEGRRKTRTPRSSSHAAMAPTDLRERVRRRGVRFGAIWAGLLVVDLATGGPFWAHWPGIGMAALLALEAAPLFVRGWFRVAHARMAVIVGALVLINIFTWTGYPWVFWPAGALILVALVHRYV